MNIRNYIVATTLLLFATNNILYAQDETDALRFSYLQPQGTARSMAIGGALGALGGDFTSLSVNPAGIGVYRRSEFTFTPSIKLNNINGTYLSEQRDDSRTRFTINNLGVVFTSAAEGKRYERSKWKSVSFGIGINRLADFNQNYTYGGRMNINTNDNNSSSGAEVFSIDANKFPGDVNNQGASGTPAYLGYQSYLLDTGANGYFPVTFNTSAVNQQRTVVQRGGISETAISLGGNYEEKLMLGATLGITSLRYNREINYEERDATNNANNYFDNFNYRETLDIRGSGVNLKLGMIYKPIDAIRIGAAIHTPTLYNLKDELNKSITTNTENFKNELGVGGSPITTVDAPLNLYEYSLVTPWRAVLSAAGIFGKYGFISVDYEYVDYASARFSFDGADRSLQNNINQSIRNTYTGASNLRVGLEGRIDQISLRLGVGYYGSPYKNANYNADRIDISAGIGFRTESWFIDLGFINSQSEVREQPYSLDPTAAGYANVIVPTAILQNSFNNAALTFGVKF
ncbi:hypothetical protein CAP35_06850 [Chitinophagaceae bacterium IBVUCB1]|nr:hypothetical protein CAP35_06850 [Chitinophagaceae bacterium IBVUCB1]